MPSNERPQGTLDAYLEAQRIAFGPLMFQAARVARDNGLLSAVSQSGSEGLSPEDAAEKANISLYASRVLLESLSAMNAVEDLGQRYRISAVGRLLLRDTMTRVHMDFVHDVCYRGAFELEASLAQGKPVGLASLGPWKNVYEGLSQLSERTKQSWFAFDHFYSDAAFPAALPHVMAPGPKSLLDVGGNTGKWAMRVARENPSLKVTVVDHPAQKDALVHNLAAEGLSGRVNVVAMDLLHPSFLLPSPYDVVWMSQFLDCFNEADIVHLLRRAKAALSPGGRVWILEAFWDRQPNEVARYCVQATSLYFACIANGQSRMYHSKDFSEAVAQAGLRVTAGIQLGYHTLWSCQV